MQLKGISIASLGIIAFVLSCAFPYFRVTSGYTQPYPMLMGALLLFMSGTQAIKTLRASWLMALAGAVLLVFAARFGLGYQEIKYFAAYVSPVLVGGGFLFCLQKDKALVVWLLKWAILAWFVVSLVQRFISGSFLSAWVGVSAEQAFLNYATGRGVLGLAPEPTHHAFHILSLCAVMGLLTKEKMWAGLGIFEAALLAGAASIWMVLALTLPFALFACRKEIAKNLSAKRVAGIIGVLACIFLFSLVLKARYLNILMYAFDDGLLKVIANDWSVNERLGGVVALFAYCVEEWLLPHGMSYLTWFYSGPIFTQKYDWLMAFNYQLPPSGLGMLLFQGGAPVALLVFVQLWGFRKARAEFWLLWVLLAAICSYLFMFYTSQPSYGLLVGLSAYLSLTRAKFGSLEQGKLASAIV